MAFIRNTFIFEKLLNIQTRIEKLENDVRKLEKLDSNVRMLNQYMNKACPDAFHTIFNNMKDMEKEIKQLKRGEKHECKCGACTEVQDDT